jgi:hypothetical protein
MTKRHQNRSKKSPRVAHKRKRPAPYVEYDGKWSEETIRRQLAQAIYQDGHGNGISLSHAGWCYPYAWSYEHVPVYFDANHSALHQEDARTYQERTIITPTQEEAYEAEVGSDGATYYSPRQEHLAPYPVTPGAKVGGTTYYSPYPSPPVSEEEVRGYIEGYHDPKLEHQTSEWWRLFGATTGEMYVLDEVKEARAAQKEEWSAERYFGPYRPQQGKVCAGCVEEPEKRKGGYALYRGEVVVEKEHKSRDDWDCDFCGSECFCWTVNDLSA